MARGAAEGIRLERDKTEIGAGAFDRRLDGGAAFRLETAIFFQQEAGAKHEVAGVPQIAFGHIARRGFGIGFFDEPFDAEEARRNRRARADVTIFGGGARRLERRT